MGGLPQEAPVGLTDAQAVEALSEARERTLALVASVSDEDLERVHSELMSPLVWDLGHIAAFEDLWIVHRYGGRPLLREDLADIYDAFETPRAGRGELDFLRPAQAREYMAEVRERALEVTAQRGVGDGVIHELIVRHEHQHNETMLQTLQLAQLAGYELSGGAAIDPTTDAPPHHRNGARAGRDPRGASARSVPPEMALPTTTSVPATGPTCAGT